MSSTEGPQVFSSGVLYANRYHSCKMDRICVGWCKHMFARLGNKHPIFNTSTPLL